MKVPTYSYISRPALFAGLEKLTIGVLVFISVIAMWTTFQPIVVVIVYFILHFISYVITRHDPEFMSIAIFRIINFNKESYEP